MAFSPQLQRNVEAPVNKSDINDRGGSAALTTLHPFIRKIWHLISPTNGGRSFGIVRLRTKGHRVFFCLESTEYYLKLMVEMLLHVTFIAIP
jgi:hypothetical protein